MKQRWILAVVLVAACGDNLNDPTIDPPTPDGPDPVTVAKCNDADMLGTLKTVPNVKTVAEQGCGQYVIQPARCYKLTFDQPVQHAAPGGQHFEQHLFLIHRTCDRPLLLADWGYQNDQFFDDELSVLFDTNALWIEHRYQGESQPTEWDWTALTIKNGAADMHEIVSAFRKYYSGRFVSTGASKGGITATYHKYLYQDDLDGSVPYVAPASRSPIDSAYQAHLTQNYPPCAQQLRDAQVKSLTTKRTMMQQRLAALGAPAGSEAMYLESMTSSIDWSFWQYYGVTYCNRVPNAQSSDEAFFNFFWQFSGFGGQISKPATTHPEEYAYGALYYEWLTEQGFALQLGSHVEPHVTEPIVMATMADNFAEMFPGVTLPAYDGTVTWATRNWVREHAGDLLLIYGQYDPWTGGAMDEPTRSTSGRYFVPNATHGAQLTKLATPDRIAALEHATRMFGKPPKLTVMSQASSAAANREALLAKLQQRQLSTGLHMMLERQK